MSKRERGGEREKEGRRRGGKAKERERGQQFFKVRQ